MALNRGKAKTRKLDFEDEKETKAKKEERVEREDDGQPLHIKCRPPGFEDFYGNETLVESLGSVLGKKKGIPHAFLFTGPSGCGKTTLARILKNELGCSERDFYEYNIANLRGIDTIREIIVNIPYAALEGKIKIYLLDEVHKLTADAQNALLKPLEDCPKHVYFILCSTDPEKILKTIKTRCTTYTVSSLPSPKMAGFVKKIAMNEGVALPRDAYMRIAEASQGSPRKALVILDQVIGIKDEDKLLAAIEKIAYSEYQVIDLCRALIKGERWSSIAKIIQGIDEDVEKVRYAILGYLGSALLKSENKTAADIIPCFLDSWMYTGKTGMIYACWRASN